MVRLSQIAAPALLSAAMCVGVGCHSHDRVPSGTAMLTEGRKDVAAVVPDAGSVYVYDYTAKKMVYSGKVDRGDDVRVDAHKDRILLGERDAIKRDDLVDDHKYQIFFKGAPYTEERVVRHREGPTVIERDRVIEHDGNTTIIKPDSDQDTTIIRKERELKDTN